MLYEKQPCAVIWFETFMTYLFYMEINRKAEGR